MSELEALLSTSFFHVSVLVLALPPVHQCTITCDQQSGGHYLLTVYFAGWAVPEPLTATCTFILVSLRKFHSIHLFCSISDFAYDRLHTCTCTCYTTFVHLQMPGLDIPA